MKRVFLAGMATMLGAASDAVFHETAKAQPNSTPISKPSEWNKLMPGETQNSVAPFGTKIKEPETVAQRVSKHTNEALIWAQKNDWDRALEHVDKAIALDPNIDLLYKFRSQTYKNLGRNSDSVKDMMKFNEMEKSNNLRAIEKFHKDQMDQGGMPDLRERVKKFLNN